MTDTIADPAADPMPELDMEKLEAFGARFTDMLNSSFAILSTSVGHRVGLFDTMAELPPSTSAEIAAAGGYSERYVREWLGAMVTAGIVEYDYVKDAYVLPREHAAMLTRAAGPGNFAAFTQFLGVISEVEHRIVDCFRNGGGVGYEHFTNFHGVMAEVSALTADAVLVEGILPLVPGIVEKLEAGIAVADVGCGQGHVGNLMAQAFPSSSVVNFDISDQALAAGRKEATDMGLTNSTFEVCDAPTLDRPEGFDFITTFDAVHDQADPYGMVAAIYKALKPGGYWLCVDISASSHVGENVAHPLGPFLYTVSCMHCMTVSLAAGGAGLGAAWGVQKAREVFADAGFTDVTVTNVPGDVVNNYYICRKALS